MKNIINIKNIAFSVLIATHIVDLNTHCKILEGGCKVWDSWTQCENNVMKRKCKNDTSISEIKPCKDCGKWSEWSECMNGKSYRKVNKCEFIEEVKTCGINSTENNIVYGDNLLSGVTNLFVNNENIDSSCNINRINSSVGFMNESDKLKYEQNILVKGTDHDINFFQNSKNYIKKHINNLSNSFLDVLGNLDKNKLYIDGDDKLMNRLLSYNEDMNHHNASIANITTHNDSNKNMDASFATTFDDAEQNTTDNEQEDVPLPSNSDHMITDTHKPIEEYNDYVELDKNKKTNEINNNDIIPVEIDKHDNNTSDLINDDAPLPTYYQATIPKETDNMKHNKPPYKGHIYHLLESDEVIEKQKENKCVEGDIQCKEKYNKNKSNHKEHAKGQNDENHQHEQPRVNNNNIYKATGVAAILFLGGGIGSYAVYRWNKDEKNDPVDIDNEVLFNEEIKQKEQKSVEEDEFWGNE